MNDQSISTHAEPMRWDAGCGVKNDPVDASGHRTTKHDQGNWYMPQPMACLDTKILGAVSAMSNVRSPL